MDEQNCKDCVLARIMEEREKLCDKRFDHIVDSISVAKLEMDRRLEGMNEFTVQLDKQAKEFITRREVELTLEKLGVKLDIIEKAMNRRVGGQQWSDHIITALITMAVFIILHYVWKF